MSEELDRGDEPEVTDKVIPEPDKVTPETDKVTPEVEAAPEPEAKEPVIPKSRFDEAVRKERAEKEALAGRVKEYEARDAQWAVADDFAEAQKAVKEMIKQHTSFLADGELDKASDLMEKILDLKEAVSERKADAKAFQAKDQAKSEVRYDALVAKMEADYPQINPDAEEFDVEAVANVQAAMSGFMQTQRLTASQALEKAMKLIFPPKAATTSGKAVDAGVRRKEAAVTKALDAKTRQPGSTNGVGVDHDKEGGSIDAAAVMKMTWDEFIKLPDSKLSEMRGDHV